MSKTLTITDDKVKEAASKCPTAKETLKILFPEVFQDSEIVARPGDRFIIAWNEYIITYSGKNLLSFHSLSDGNYWQTLPDKVKNDMGFTYEEFKAALGYEGCYVKEILATKHRG